MNTIIFLHNLYTLTALLPAVFLFYLALNLIGLDHRIRPTLYLGLAFLSGGFLFLSQSIGSLVLHPSGAFHQWSSMIALLLLSLFFVLFILHFPEPPSPRINRITVGSGVFLITAVTVVFILLTLGSDTLFQFSNHRWVFNSLPAEYIMTTTLMVFTVSFLLISLWKMASSGLLRRGIIIISVVLISGALVHILVYAWGTGSRPFPFSTDILFYFLVIPGALLAVGTYLHYSVESVSLQTRILAVTLMFFLLLFGIISVVAIHNHEKSYDLRQQGYLQASVATGQPAGEMLFLSLLQPEGDEPVTRKFASRFPDRETSELIEDKLVYTRIIYRALENRNTSRDSRDLFADSNLPPGFAGYKLYIEHMARRKDLSKDDPAGKILSSLRKEAYKVESLHKRMKSIADERFTSFYRSLSFNRHSLAHFLDLGLRSLADPEKIPGSRLKLLALEVFIPLYLSPQRQYLKDDGVPVSLAYLLSEGDHHYMAGFTYTGYRRYIHTSTRLYILILLFTLVSFGLLYRYVLLRYLFQPLSDIGYVMKEAASGNLEITIPDVHEEEILTIRDSLEMLLDFSRKEGFTQLDYTEANELTQGEDEESIQSVFDHIRTLMDQQAGDYFLTSLLIDPLNSNRSTGVNIDFETLVIQKKKFQFRNWEKELGGDLCLTHSFFLKGKLYSVFCNADAMGKSMQGAGGALVLGSVLQSIINRTRFSSMEQERSPEIWLKDTFTEMNRVFLTFDGSMMISMILGLADDETGMVYFINAEHPWSVLLRDGKARFIEKELVLRKLGFDDPSQRVTVRTFHMLEGDRLIFGSDGRDDIAFEVRDGERIINEDENLFLKMTEKGGGEPDSIVEAIQSMGDLTDDLSLIRISFEPKFPREKPIGSEEEARVFTEIENMPEDEAIDRLLGLHAEYQQNVTFLRELCLRIVKEKRYNEAIPFLENYIDRVPEETTFIYYLSFCCRKTGRLDEALDSAQRIVLREPDNIRYLIHLVKVHLQAGNYIEADQLLDVILKIDPNNRRAISLKESL
jgi:HAMP domain-containing protein